MVVEVSPSVVKYLTKLDTVNSIIHYETDFVNHFVGSAEMVIQKPP